MFKTCSLRLFVPRVTYILNKHLACCFDKRNRKNCKYFCLKSSWSSRHASCTEFFSIFPQIGCLQRKHRFVVLLLQHLVEHVRRTFGTMQWWSKMVNFTGFICFCRSMTTARVATSQFFADLLYKSSGTNFGFANDFVQSLAIYPGQVNYIIKYVYWPSRASSFDGILMGH